MKSRNLIKILEKGGWELNRINGSHHIFKHPIKKGTPSVPHPKQ